MEETIQTHKKGEDERNFTDINAFTPLGSLTLLGSLIAIHVCDYLKARETKEVEA